VFVTISRTDSKEPGFSLFAFISAGRNDFFPHC
jgi:hypothetical protein